MLDPNLKPQEIYSRRNELGLENTIDLLSEIIEGDKDFDRRKNAIKYISMLPIKTKELKKEICGIIESVLISDENIDLKCPTKTS